MIIQLGLINVTGSRSDEGGKGLFLNGSGVLERWDLCDISDENPRKPFRKR